MKNLTTSIVADEDGNFTSNADLLRMVIERAPKDGLTLPQMTERMPILEKINEAAPEADFGFGAKELIILDELMETHPWGGIHADIVALGAALKDAVAG